MHTTEKHSPTYYIIRSLVRGTVWLFMPLAMIFTYIDWSVANERPDCPITFHFDFTYDNNGYTEGMDCHMPYNVEIDGQGNWRWTN